MQKLFPPSLADEHGNFGKFGGAYIPEMLYKNIEELRNTYEGIIESPEFETQFLDLLKNYVGRPTPLYHAQRLSLQYGCRIFLKREDLCHTGSHKVNNTIGQILLASYMGKKRIIAETGAGQHGVATATVCALLGLECFVHMGKKDIQRQLPNVKRMKMLGASVIPATSGSQTLKDATNEALRNWIEHPDAYYLIGSVVGPHPYPDLVGRFQSVISRELKEQFPRETGKTFPDLIVACVGGGSNAIGAFYHYLQHEKVALIGVEAAGKGIDSGRTAATIATGSHGVLHGSKTLMMQTPDGQVTEAECVSAGLDYPGVGPVHAFLHSTGRATYVSVDDSEALNAGLLLTRMEGIIPALESAHALAALEKIDNLAGRDVVVNLSGRGDKDMESYAHNLSELRKIELAEQENAV